MDETVFAIFRKEAQAEAAVDELVASGFPREYMAVLCPKNQDTREFAKRKGTRVAKGIDKGPYANIPLDGTLGVRHPEQGPLPGALHEALVDMGVPPVWCDLRVVGGKFLISVQCRSRDEFFRATGILKFTGACDICWPGSDRLDELPISFPY